MHPSVAARSIEPSQFEMDVSDVSKRNSDLFYQIGPSLFKTANTRTLRGIPEEVTRMLYNRQRLCAWPHMLLQMQHI